MSRNDGYRGGNRNRNWNKNSSKGGGGTRKNSEQRKRYISPEQQKAAQENESAIKAFKADAPVCEICGQNILEQSTAISNRVTGNPVHFDCVINKISETEKPGANERLTYIGQGRFAILHFDNPHDMRHFKIVRTIEWEGREQKRGEWRNEMAGLFSQVR